MFVILNQGVSLEVLVLEVLRRVDEAVIRLRYSIHNLYLHCFVYPLARVRQTMNILSA